MKKEETVKMIENLLSIVSSIKYVDTCEYARFANTDTSETKESLDEKLQDLKKINKRVLSRVVTLRGYSKHNGLGNNALSLLMTSKQEETLKNMKDKDLEYLLNKYNFFDNKNIKATMTIGVGYSEDYIDMSRVIETDELIYYTICNTLFCGTFQNTWSELHDDTTLTDYEEAKKLYEKVISEDWQKSLAIYNKEEVIIYLEKISLPIDKNSNAIFNEQVVEDLASETIEIID